MIVLKSIEDIDQLESTVVTIGNFDGVHIGHQVLLLKAVSIAKKLKVTSVALTFDPHPTQVLRANPPPKLITSFDQKKELISNQGIDVLLCIPFTKEFSSVSASDFIESMLVENMGMKVMVIGKDYAFGKNRVGDISMLKKYAVQLNFRVIVEKLIGSIGLENAKISSTAIRSAIIEGKIESANKMLGRHYCMRGTVVHGKNIGEKLLGFPTANVFPDNILYPKKGVYAVNVKYKNQIFDGVANIGYNPTFQNKSLSLEVHILSFSNKIYGEKIEVLFIKRLRDEVKFISIEELEKQIAKDIIEAKHHYFNKGSTFEKPRA